MVWATRGITAGSVFATTELRVLLLEWLDENASLSQIIVLTVYVDDTSFEATGAEVSVRCAVSSATKHFTSSLRRIGMEFRPSKNGCLASSDTLAASVIKATSRLRVYVQRRTKSLGCALGGGKRRNTQVQRSRLRAFKARKDRFQKLRRAVGAERSGLVLRTGGTAALVYGQANTGVADSVLLEQRRAVAAASVPGGAGDLDLTLIMADGGRHGMADPAFAAHQMPIAMWAEAVWCGWLSKDTLQALAGQSLQRILGRDAPWSRVTGPATAFVASARRLSWVVRDATQLLTDNGLRIDLTRDSPAFVRRQVSDSVRRWRWRSVERRIPSLRRGAGGFGAYLQPIFRLLQAKPSEHWGRREKGALRSALTNRQWTQCRLHSAGLARNKNCQLCVQLGYCAEDDADPKHRGTLLHRIWLCPAMEPFRQSLVPSWLRSQVRRALQSDGSMTPADLLMYTRALVSSPAASLKPPPPTETFERVKEPMDGIVSGKIYVDGSRIYGDSNLAGLCARQGWAFAAYDDAGALCAAARGRPPAWVEGIHGAELWGLAMAVSSADPWTPIRVDCLAVQKGAQKDKAWAEAPDRCLARVWAPVIAALDDGAQRVVWK